MKARAFTLIELLVVVAIIALLISILLPSLSSARATARVVKCQSIQKQYFNANSMYADANNNCYVPIKTKSGATPGTGTYFSWESTNANHSAGIMFRQMLGINVSPQGSVNVPGPLACPDRPVPSTFAASYAWSEIFIRKGGPNTFQPQPGWGEQLMVERPLVLLSSDKMAFVDATDWHMYSQGNMNYAGANKWDLWGETKNNAGAYRHKEGANVVHFDGHGSWYGKKELYHPSGGVRNRIMDIYRR